MRDFLVAVCLSVLVTPGVLVAQAFNYPSLQLPRASTRDYTAALAGGSGSTLLFQWREGAGTGMHWQVDAGLADPKGPTDPLLFGGGGIARELTRATADQPLDLLLTAGAGVAIGGNGTTLRVPVGLSLGHRFALDGGMALTPYVHPRVSIDVCSRCGTDRDRRSSVSLNFDLGAEWQVNRRFGVIGAISISGSDVFVSSDTFAVGLRWTPASLAGPFLR
jgi:hypothetical protein